MRTVFTVDPGSSGTGIAIWDHSEYQFAIESNPRMKQIRKSHPVNPKYVLHLRKESRMELLKALQQMIVEFDCVILICEDCEYRKGLKGQMVAERGDLVSLAKLIGGLEYLCFNLGVSFEAVSAGKWKGQWDKAKVVDHIKKVWPDSVNHCKNEKTAHTWEAVGIGFYKIGLL